MVRGPVRAVIFDLGSTLIYEKDAWEAYFPRADAELWRALHEAGVSLQPHDLYGNASTLFELYYTRHRNDLNEPTMVRVLAELLHERGFSLPGDTLREAMRAMFAVTQSNWFPEEESLPTLRQLRERGLEVGLISNASDDDNTQALVDKGGFRPYLEFILSSATIGKRKPHPEIFKEALNRLKVPPRQAIMVGDDYEADIVGANRAGIQSIWITRRVRGTGLENAGKEASAVVSSLAEIPPLLTDAQGARFDPRSPA